MRALATAGADCILTSRSVEAGERVAKDILERGAKGNVSVLQLDLADLDSVKKCAESIIASLPNGLDLLILNAGIMACPQGVTKQGFELQIGTNHFGHFYLTKLLMPKLLQARKKPARVVAVSSYAHQFGVNSFDVDDLNFEKKNYTAWGSYGNSKLANILFASELAKRYKDKGIVAYSLHPGSIATNLGRHSWAVRYLATPFLKLFSKNVQQGASTTIYAAVGESLESGSYLEDCKVSKPHERALDSRLAADFWEKTEQLLAAALQK